MDERTIKNKIKNLISKDEIEKAIDELLYFLDLYPSDNSHENTIVLQSGRLHRLIKEIRNGTIDWEKSDSTKTRISKSILDSIDIIFNPNQSDENNRKLEVELKKLNDNIEEIKRRKFSLRSWSIGFISFGILLFVMLTVIYRVRNSESHNSKPPVELTVKGINDTLTNQVLFEAFEIGNDLIRTSININLGDSVNINSSGAISLGKLIGHSNSPNGINHGVLGLSADLFSFEENLPHGALMYRVSDKEQSSEWYFCGESVSFVSDRNGFLEFAINDKELTNNEGYYKVRIKLSK